MPQVIGEGRIGFGKPVEDLNHLLTISTDIYRSCHLHLIRSATHLGPDFAYNSFSNPPFLPFIRSANALFLLR
jgi:hypothetical protein